MTKYEQSGKEFLTRVQQASTIEGEFYETSAVEVLDNVASLLERSPNVLVTLSNKELTDFLGDYASRNDLFDSEGNYDFKSLLSFLGEKTGKDLSFLAPIIEKMGKGEKVGFSDLVSLQGLFSFK